MKGKVSNAKDNVEEGKQPTNLEEALEWQLRCAVVTCDFQGCHVTRAALGEKVAPDVYPDDEYEQTLHLCDETSPYALTGAIFGTDRFAIIQATEILTHAAGNFYINDKPTGAVVGQQPFGGSRASGTNDKAGSIINLQRWVSPRTIKENFLPPLDFSYAHMKEM